MKLDSLTHKKIHFLQWDVLQACCLTVHCGLENFHSSMNGEQDRLC